MGMAKDLAFSLQWGTGGGGGGDKGVNNYIVMMMMMMMMIIIIIIIIIPWVFCQYFKLYLHTFPVVSHFHESVLVM